MKKYLLIFLVAVSNSFGQTPPSGIETGLSPNGVLDDIFDHYGNKYKLSDIIVGKDVRDENSQVLRATNPTPMSCGYYNLYFEDGSGMENTSNTTHMARRAVVCQVFTDLSNFINTPLTTNGLNNKVNIWVRNINATVAPNSSTGILGLASSFYTIPRFYVGVRGITDNEIWKTIHTGLDSYTNVVSPTTATSFSAGTSGLFYHGIMAFNFTDTTTPINWNTNLTVTSFPNLYDLYSVVLHEVTHALGFGSLINSTGASIFGSSYPYYSRYDRFLKNSTNTHFLLTSSGCGTGSAGSMYNYTFNSSLNTSILQPNPASCTNSIRYVGTNNIQVYTPIVFSPSSSLSHFDGLCITPNPNFTLSYNMGTNVIRRFLKSQERNVLGDIGYSLNTTYGISSTYQGTTTYTNTLNGISVAGTNDGINTDGSYKYIGTAGTPIVINSSTDPTKRILSNDTSASTNFECLEDISDNTAVFNFTSGNSTTNVTFTSTIPGIHLLRYVPKNSTGTQKGNITYVYVNVKPILCTSTPSSCNLVVNGNFEANNSIPTNIGRFRNVCDWFNVNDATPDYFHRNSSLSNVNVPCNIFGYQEVNTINGGNAYVGVLNEWTGATNNQPYREIIGTELTQQLMPNQNYQLSFDISLADGSSSFAYDIQAYLSSSQIPNYVGSGFLPNQTASNLYSTSNVQGDFTNWKKIIFNVQNFSGGEKFLYLGSLINSQINTNNPQTDNQGCNYQNFNLGYPQYISQQRTYYYIDNVSLIPLNGGSFTLPSTLCQTQTLSNLNTYLDGLPTNGVFSGNGVTLYKSRYSLDTTNIPLGVNTISYTYTNSLGCSVTIYSNITINDCGCNCLPTIYYTYTISGNTVTFNVLNSNPNCSNTLLPLALYWRFGDGTFVRNVGTTFSHTYPGPGSYLVSMTATIAGHNDISPCEGEPLYDTVTINSGRFSGDMTNQNNSENVSIYPNPTESKFKIKIDNNIDEEVLIIARTIEGKEIFRQIYNLKEGNQIIDIEMPSSISDGLILVEISSNNIKVSKNLLIKN